MVLESYGLEFWVNLVTLLFFIRFALPKIKIKKRDLIPILIIGLASSTTLFLDLPNHVRASEFDYLSLAEGIANGWGNINCMHYEDGNCLMPQHFTRTSAFPLLIVPFIWLGIGVSQAGRIMNLILGTFSGILMYLALKEQVGRNKSLAGGLAFTVLVPKILQQFTALSEISSMAFLVFSIYFISRLKKSKDKEIFMAAAITVSFFANIRPENFLGAIPLVLLLIYKFFKKGFSKEKITWFWLLFLCLNWLFASNVMLSQTDVEGWDWTINKRIELFRTQAMTNLEQLIGWDIANPILSLLFVWGSIKAVKDRNLMLIAIAFSFIILFGVYSSFDFDASGMPRMLLLLTLISFTGSLYLPSNSKILQLFAVFCFVLILINSRSSRMGPINDLIIAFETDEFNLSNDMRPIYFTPEQLPHLVFPLKTIKAQDLLKFPPEAGGPQSGESIFIYSHYMTDDVSVFRGCNRTLLEEYQLAKKYLIECPIIS